MKKEKLAPMKTMKVQESFGPTYFDMFASKNDRIKKHLDSLDETYGSWWWLRLAENKDDCFIGNESDGSGFYASSFFRTGVVLDFCM